MAAEQRINEIAGMLASSIPGATAQQFTGFATLFAKLELDSRTLEANQQAAAAAAAAGAPVESEKERDAKKQWTTNMSSTKSSGLFKFRSNDGKENGFKRWKWMFELAVRNFCEVIHDRMKRAENQEQPIPEDNLPTPLAEFNFQLYYAIAQWVEGDPHDVIRSCDGHGLEAWRSLTVQYSKGTHTPSSTTCWQKFSHPLS